MSSVPSKNSAGFKRRRTVRETSKEDSGGAWSLSYLVTVMVNIERNCCDGGGGGSAWGVGKRQGIKLWGENQLFKKHIVMPGSFMVVRM